MAKYECTKNGKKCSLAKKHFGLTKDFGCAGFILPDGKMIDLCYKEKDWTKRPLWVDKHEHHEVGRAYGKHTFQEMECFMKQCKAIRFRKQGKTGVIRVSSMAKPTSKQIDAIQKAVKEGCSRFAGYKLHEPMTLGDLDPVHKTNGKREAKPSDVMKWVNKGW